MVKIVATVRERVEGVRRDVERRRDHVPFLDIAWRTWELDVRANGGVLAAAVAYRLFLFLVPLALTLITGFGVLADSSGESPRDLARQAGITGLIASAVGNAGTLTPLNRAVLLAGGLWASVSAAGSLLRVLDASHLLAWGDRALPRRRKASAVAVVLGATGLVVLLLLIGRLREAHSIAGVAMLLVATVVPLVGWCWAAGRLPHAAAPRWALVPGAAVVAVGLQVVHVVTVYYLSRQVSGRSQTYGTLGVAMAVLLWSFFVARLVVVAAELNASAWQRRPGSAGAEHPDPPIREWGGLLRHHFSPVPSPLDGGGASAEDVRATSVLTVWSFAGPDGAEEAQAVLAGDTVRGRLALEDSATVRWDPGSDAPRTRQLHDLTRRGSAHGALWGALLGSVFLAPLLGAAVGAAVGAVGGSLTDVGIDDDAIAAIRSRLAPGTSVLFVLSSGADVGRITDVLAECGGARVAVDDEDGVDIAPAAPAAEG